MPLFRHEVYSHDILTFILFLQKYTGCGKEETKRRVRPHEGIILIKLKEK